MGESGVATEKPRTSIFPSPASPVFGVGVGVGVGSEKMGTPLTILMGWGGWTSSAALETEAEIMDRPRVSDRGANNLSSRRGRNEGGTEKYDGGRCSLTVTTCPIVRIWSTPEVLQAISGRRQQRRPQSGVSKMPKHGG